MPNSIKKESANIIICKQLLITTNLLAFVYFFRLIIRRISMQRIFSLILQKKKRRIIIIHRSRKLPNSIDIFKVHIEINIYTVFQKNLTEIWKIIKKEFWYKRMYPVTFKNEIKLEDTEVFAKLPGLCFSAFIFSSFKGSYEYLFLYGLREFLNYLKISTTSVLFFVQCIYGVRKSKPTPLILQHLGWQVLYTSSLIKFIKNAYFYPECYVYTVASRYNKYHFNKF